MTRGVGLVGAALLAVAALAGGCSDDDGSGPRATAPTTTVLVGVDAATLEPGDCLTALPTGAADRVETVPCGRRHRAEVYGTFELPAAGFPGGRAVGRAARNGCGVAYQDYTGEPRDALVDLAFAELVPTAAGWERGERGVVCLAAAPDGRRARGSIADQDAA